jgi:hypothetical protein
MRRHGFHYPVLEQLYSCYPCRLFLLLLCSPCHPCRHRICLGRPCLCLGSLGISISPCSFVGNMGTRKSVTLSHMPPIHFGTENSGAAREGVRRNYRRGTGTTRGVHSARRASVTSGVDGGARRRRGCRHFGRGEFGGPEGLDMFGCSDVWRTALGKRHAVCKRTRCLWRLSCARILPVPASAGLGRRAGWTPRVPGSAQN